MIKNSNEDAASNKKPRILVLALDFDGCLFNPLYFRSKSANRLIESNHILITHILTQIFIHKYDRVIFTSVSNRQAKEIDDGNMKASKSESSYPALIAFCNYISSKTAVPCEVDRFLLSDIYGNKPNGENFTHA